MSKFHLSTRVFLCCFTVIAITLMASTASAGIVAGWDYNAESSIGDASIGTGTTSGGGSFPFSNTLPNSNGSSADPGTTVSSGLNNQEWTRRGPNAGEADATRDVTWATSTAGYSDIIFEWDMVAGHRTTKHYQIYSSTDGTNFSPVSGGVGSGSTTAGVGAATIDNAGLITVNFDDGYEPEPGLDPANPIDYLFDLSYAFGSGSAVENNPNFAVRIAAVYGPGNTDFVSSSGGTPASDMVAGYLRSGETDTRYDLVTIEGTRIPEPTGIALIAWALAFGALVRRRR